MRIFSIIAIFVYTLLFSMIGAVLIALSLRAASLDSTMNMLNQLVHAENIRLGLALTGFLLILINISIAQLSIGKLRRHKTIAFENPYGQVTLSLTAVEDYIRRLTNRMSEIKEIRSNITAGKKGIEVVARVALYSDVNIPEVTEKIQNAIRLKLQEMLGIEETVTIRIHVTKIARREKEKKGSEQKTAQEETQHSGFKGEIEYGR